MVVVVISIVVGLLVGAWWAMRQVQRNKRFDYAPNEELLSQRLMGSGRIEVESVATLAEATQEILDREIAYDAADDLLDPRNPHHAQRIREHPDEATDGELDADQSGT